MIVMVIYEVRPLSKASTEQGFYGVRPLGEVPMEHLLLPVLLLAAAVAAAAPSLPLLPIPSAETVVSSTSRRCDRKLKVNILRGRCQLFSQSFPGRIIGDKMMENPSNVDGDRLLEEPSAVVWFTIYAEVPVLANRDPVCSIVPLQNTGSVFFVYEDAPTSNENRQLIVIWPSG